MSYIKWMDNLSFAGKLIFSLPILDLAWALYRIIKGVEKKNTGLLVVGILWLIFGWMALWIIDFITTIIYQKPILTDTVAL